MQKRGRINIITAVVLVVLTVYMLCTLSGLYRKITRTAQENARLEQEVERQRAENDVMRYAVEHSNDDSVIEDAARRELGLVYPDETVYESGD